MARNAETLAGRAAAWSSALRLAEVPVQVVDTARTCILDLVGVSLAGARDPLCARVAAYATFNHAPGTPALLGRPERLSPVGAALVNGTAAHVLDFDDTSYTGIMHGSAVVFPAALAAVQHAGGDGRRLLEAFIAGSEVSYALALLCGTGHYFSGWWSTATFGVFGAAAAAARGLGLDAARTRMALAIAGAQASGLKAAFGTDAKPYMAGRAAAAGVEAALLAAAGVTGPADVLENSRGFLKLFDGEQGDRQALDQIGVNWRLVDPGVFFKQFPVCSGAHAAAELTLRLLERHALLASDIAEVICEVTPTVAISLVHDRPQTPQEAQFSMPFAVGSILAFGNLGIASLAPHVLTDPAMREAMAKVRMIRDDSLHDEHAPEGTRVTIVTPDGQRFTDYLGQPTGMPGNPMSADALRGKFLRCCDAGGISPAEAERLYRHICSIETTAVPLPAMTAPAVPA
jgi:2-methylcitrate dehydratase PrpD